MKFVAVLLLCALGGANADAVSKHPIVKVIDLLKGLKAKSFAQGQSEQVEYEKFVYWCTTSKATLKSAIADEKETISELEDTLAGLKKEKETLEDEIDTLDGELKDLAASAKAAKDTRGDEAGLYKKANKDLDSTIKAVDGCIKALQGAESKTEGLLLAQHHVKMMLSLVAEKATDKQIQVL